MLAKRRELHQPVEISVAVTPGLRARQLERLSSIRFDLRRDSFLLCLFQNLLRQILPTDEQRKRYNLHIVVGAMVVLRGGFLTPILAVEHPLEKPSKPTLETALVFARQSLRACKQTDRIN